VLENVQDANWAANGESMAVFGRPGEQSLAAGVSIGKVLLDGINWIGQPKISPDGKLVAFADHENTGAMMKVRWR